MIASGTRSVSALACLAAVLVCAFIVVALVRIDDQKLLAACLAIIVLASFVAVRSGLADLAEASAAQHAWTFRGAVISAGLLVLFVLREDIFGLLMLATVLIYVTTCLGVTIQ